MTLDQAIGNLRLQVLTSDLETSAISLVLAEIIRFRKALNYYAYEDNYIDGAPFLKGEDGLFDRNDDGAMARNALRLEDYNLGIVVPASNGPDGISSEA